MSYIKRDCIEKIIDQSDIVQVFESLGHQLQKRGANLFCKSPFNEEKTPSCVVSPARQSFKDFSSDKSGNVITLLMETQNMSYPEAVKWLANYYHIDVEYEDEAAAKRFIERQNYKDSLRPLLKQAHASYQKAFKDLPDDHPAKKEVFERRMYDEDVCVEWGIGYAPGGKHIFNQAKANNYLENAKSLFLIGDEYDKYWERVIYPIHDKNGLLIGLAGRDVSGKEGTARWINSAETLLYNKEKVWYGLDKALRSIRKNDEAWIVEGYNDVIAWHRFNITNTVASCGTAITQRQIQELKRYTKSVRLAMDGDKAGEKSILKYIPLFMAKGFTVYVTDLDGLDPDDFVRANADQITNHKGGLEGLLSHPDYKKHGFQHLMHKYLDKTDEFTLGNTAKELCKTIALVDDFDQRSILSAWLAKESKVIETSIKAWVNGFMEKSNAKTLEQSLYNFPKYIDINHDEVIPIVEKYGLFISKDRIWMKLGNEAPYYFDDVSNFSIEIIQHMQDEKFPMKLLRIRNVNGDERIFDVPSEQLNTPQNFDTAMTNHGNFLWTGGRNEFQKLRRYLYDRMGVGSKIEILGWQPEKFWVWNNAITIPGEGTRDIDENGVFKKGSVSYYIPSANRIYEHNSFKFLPQKKAVLRRSDLTFTKYASQMIKVHRDHAITAILFTVSTAFLDIVEDKLGNFPLLFLYGPASSGKDQLIDCCQSFFGYPQSPIHIGNKVSTQKAQIRKFAQFRNMIVHLSEYRPGDAQLDELLKGFWDRRGYERGTIDSAYGTETVPVTSSVIFTGNHYPDDDPLITRIICEEMIKTDFDHDAKLEYQKLSDMTKLGISYFVEELIQHREFVQSKFKETFRKVEKTIKSIIGLNIPQERMVQNVSILGAFYELLSEKISFPFTFNEYTTHIAKVLENQQRKLATASIQTKWWDCFLATVRTKMDPLIHGKEFEVEDNKLYFVFTHTYNRVSTQWYAQHHEQAPKKATIIDMVKKDAAFQKEKNSHRMEFNKTSVWVMDLKQLMICEELMDAIEWQKREQKDMPKAYASGQNEPENAFAKNQISLLHLKENPF
jgi:DNA primase